MRLIDADKLHREEIDDIICYSVQQIENAPTVDVLDKIRAEVKKMDTLITRSEVLEVIDKCLKGEANDKT